MEKLNNIGFWQAVSAIIVVLAPALIVVYDIAITILIGHEATITYAVQQFARKFEELPYIAGGIFMWLWLHLFFKIVTQG